MTLARLFATLCGIGYLRPAPGTWGSLAALPLAWALHGVAGPWGLVAATLAVAGLGWAATARMTRNMADHDPGEIVIDEVAGQWIALWPLAFGAANNDVAILALWPGWIAAFVLFRAFDIAKPGPIGSADRRGDALGVMLDDLIAGIFAALGVVLLAGLWHGVMLR